MRIKMKMFAKIDISKITTSKQTGQAIVANLPPYKIDHQ
jgi:hypothetical protein